ncbi:MAG: methyltransferase domain-containing protein [Candidatus Omnitrophica bacterium]|nr:methyltransferase domain-containing protein [Candidatus Omnitrophota bacterium]
MFEKNALLIMGELKESDIVLDIGAWFKPFNRANWVVDIMPYDTRGRAGSCAGTNEYFSKETWLNLDVCDGKKLPFKDKEIDFVICSHVLEDVRDPVFLCSEIVRVGKRGYIEVPSMLSELSLGVESKKYAGRYHHRWLVDIRDNRIDFLFKPHFIHSSRKYHFPWRYGKALAEEASIKWLFWKDSFEFGEKTIIDYDMFLQEIEGFVRCAGVYSGVIYAADDLLAAFKKALKGLLKRI